MPAHCNTFKQHLLRFERRIANLTAEHQYFFRVREESTNESAHLINLATMPAYVVLLSPAPPVAMCRYLRDPSLEMKLTGVNHRPGDQHTSLVNPFDLAPQRISEWTAEEAATLQTRLEKQLGPEYLSTRPGPSGQRLTYIGAEKIIALANEVFGFNGWSSSIRDVKIDYYEEEKPSGKICIGVSVIVRVTLRDGTYHEDVGFGHVENNRSRFQCYEKAKKEGTTDALKRALRQFGNLLGLCVYDKAYVSKVAKVKAVPVKFDENALHRHPDFVVKNEPSGMIKQEKTDLSAQQPPSLRPPQCKDRSR